MILMNIIYTEFTEMTINERTFSQKNTESNIFLYKVILLLATMTYNQVQQLPNGLVLVILIIHEINSTQL